MSCIEIVKRVQLSVGSLYPFEKYFAVRQKILSILKLEIDFSCPFPIQNFCKECFEIVGISFQIISNLSFSNNLLRNP